jgi:hypothetical protein
MHIPTTILFISIIFSSFSGGCATRDARMSPSAETTLSAIRREYANVADSQSLAFECNGILAISYNELSRKLDRMEINILEGNHLDERELAEIQNELTQKNIQLQTCCSKRAT